MRLQGRPGKRRALDGLQARTSRLSGWSGLLLTTEVMIAEAPKDESDHMHPAPGGMGGMGDMGM